ncbi:uncharacterized protein LOC111712415 isoform X2 [Eurytemora carolleeae]|uniref:uncharacterized protein LOC111712415 isoform X2 n=1 Tax=Eurytemora carolleeae TaxID=1294199 RepID=UPI000C7929F4|nr:uncharacterized protein LOC111712415 isoform X2 [Eurytemora carolleeae]|eukprot:XP_023342780.1 uncharacterized protein LOC111712415 isoform X2 [Eurytemora affinis]
MVNYLASCYLLNLVVQGRITDDVKTVINMVRKDVLRTDRQHPFYAGEGNHNVTSLFNILTTYALNHPSVSYCQGMSDLASPILVIMVEESHAYICFTALMNRMKPNFMLDGVAMTTKFQHLSEGLMYYDPEFYTYLKLHMADDLLFCYRWLLLEMKREFPFDLAMKALEVTWSSLPPATADTRIELWETKFSPKMSPSSTDLSKPCQTPYGKVAATIRKQSVDRQLSDNTDVKSSEAKKDFNLKRSGFSSGGKKNSIEDGKSTPEKKSSVESKRLEKNINEEITKVLDKQGAGDVAEEAVENDALTSGKRVTNLKDFYSLTKPETKKEESEKKYETPVKRKVESRDDDNKLPTCSLESTRPQSTEPSSTESRHGEDPFDFVGYSQANNALTIFCNRLPPPTQFGHGNPFLMFLCLSSLLQHRDHIMRNELDYQDIAMFFDKMVRGHDVDRVLCTARRMFAEYLNEDWSPSPQPTVSSQVPNC